MHRKEMKMEKKIYVDYEIYCYEVRAFNTETKQFITETYGSEEKAIEAYKRLLSTKHMYGLELRKIQSACQFYDENQYVYTFDE